MINKSTLIFDQSYTKIFVYLNKIRKTNSRTLLIHNLRNKISPPDSSSFIKTAILQNKYPYLIIDVSP